MEVLESKTELNDDLRSQLRCHTARAAILAAAAKGKDEPPLDDAAKATLQKQAIDWLQAELAANRAREPRIVAVAAQLADLLLTETTRLRVLKPTGMTSENGATLTLQRDGSILVSGNNVSGNS